MSLTNQENQLNGLIEVTMLMIAIYITSCVSLRNGNREDARVAFSCLVECAEGALFLRYILKADTQEPQKSIELHRRWGKTTNGCG